MNTTHIPKALSKISTLLAAESGVTLAQYDRGCVETSVNAGSLATVEDDGFTQRRFLVEM
jgi:hypothetical protein